MNLATMQARSHFVARFFVWYVGVVPNGDGSKIAEIKSKYSYLMSLYGSYENCMQCDWEAVNSLIAKLITHIGVYNRAAIASIVADLCYFCRYLSPIEQQMTLEILENYYG